MELGVFGGIGVIILDVGRMGFGEGIEICELPVITRRGEGRKSGQSSGGGRIKYPSETVLY